MPVEDWRHFTERLRAEMMRAELAAIVDSSGDAIIGTSLEGKITSWNKAAAAMFGYTSHEAVGQSMQLLVPQERVQEEMALLTQVQGGRPDHDIETVRLRQDGSHKHAINLLSLETIQGLVLTAQVFEHFQKRPARGLTLEALWNHSMTVGAAARMIAKAEGGDATFVEEAFLAGLLHDVGVLALLTKSDGEYEAVLQNPTRQVESLAALEREALGASHAEVGAYLVGLWGISDPIVEAIAYHHTPESCAESAYSSLTIVSAIHAILTETDSHAFEGHATLNEDYFRGANVLDRLPLWRDITAQAFTNGENND